MINSSPGEMLAGFVRLLRSMISCGSTPYRRAICQIHSPGWTTWTVVEVVGVPSPASGVLLALDSCGRGTPGSHRPESIVQLSQSIFEFDKRRVCCFRGTGCPPGCIRHTRTESSYARHRVSSSRNLQGPVQRQQPARGSVLISY